MQQSNIIINRLQCMSLDYIVSHNLIPIWSFPMCHSYIAWYPLKSHIEWKFGKILTPRHQTMWFLSCHYIGCWCIPRPFAWRVDPFYQDHTHGESHIQPTPWQKCSFREIEKPETKRLKVWKPLWTHHASAYEMVVIFPTIIQQLFLINLAMSSDYFLNTIHIWRFATLLTLLGASNHNKTY